MSLQTVLRTVNALALVLVLGLAALGYYFLWRPLPRVSGVIEAPVSGPVRIERDRLGTPHITAGSLEDALFAQGFAAAQDRMWQMDAIRRKAAGQLSEIVGRAALESDTASRKLRLPRVAEESVRRLGPESRRLLGAYARGVNHYIRTHQHHLPPEFQLLGYSPRPWRMSDTLLVGLEMYRTLTTTWEDDLLRFRMRQGGDAAKVDALFPERTGKEILPGSNAWVLSGKHTASGKPILANDPHLPFTMPSTWWMVHLKAPGLNVAGAALPGIPGILSGHNEHIAWGVTNLGYDVQDLYIEQMDLRTGRYRHKGQILQARPETDFIAVRQEKPVPLVSWVTVHGPVFASETNRVFSLRWTAAEQGVDALSILQLNQARNWEEFREALRRFPGPGQNFLYADREGNIGYQAAGWLPVRRGFDGRLPLDGASGEQEWEGLIPWEEMPHSLNPPSGRIVSANQNPFPTGFPGLGGGQFAAHYRQIQIEDLLQARGGWKAGDMLLVQKDVYSGFARFLAGLAGEAVRRHRSPLPGAVAGAALLEGWNGQMEKGTPQPLLAHLLFQQIRRQLAEKANSEHGAKYRAEISAAAVEALLRARPPGWVEDWDDFVVNALAEAVEEGRRRQGRNLNKWDWGEFNRTVLAHPVASQNRLLAPYFNIGPVPMSGSPHTIKQTTPALGPSMRFVADLSRWDESLMNITAGQSAHRLSGHYKDQWEAYYTGSSFPLEYETVRVKSTLELRPTP